MEATICRPDEPKHFMVLRSIDKLVKIRLPNGDLLAESDRAIRLMESGKTLYDPVIYLPVDDVMVELIEEARQTKCPLKGSAAYFGITIGQSTHERIAWSYTEPLEFAQQIKGLVAFYGSRVVVEEHPL